MSELEEYKEEKIESEDVASEPKNDPEKKKKKMSITTKIIIGLIILSMAMIIFKFSYKPKQLEPPKSTESIAPADTFSSDYDLKSEVSRFLQKQIEYIM